MGRLKQIKVGLDALTEARLTVRAEGSSASVSEYVRALIVRDLSRGAGGDAPAEDALAATASASLGPQLLELALVTGILVRAQLARTMGEEEARKVQARAQEKTAEQLKALLPSLESESDLESVS